MLLGLGLLQNFALNVLSLPSDATPDTKITTANKPTNDTTMNTLCPRGYINNSPAAIKTPGNKYAGTNTIFDGNLKDAQAAWY